MSEASRMSKMESTSSKNGRPNLITERKCLFPVMSGSRDEPTSRPCLFPSANLTVKDTKRDNGQDWLENKSFTSVTAKKLVEFQQELKLLNSDVVIDEVPLREASVHGEGTSNTVNKKRYDTINSDSDHSIDYKRRNDRDDTRRYKGSKKKKRRHYSSSDSDSDEQRSGECILISDKTDKEVVTKKKNSRKHYSSSESDAIHQNKKECIYISDDSEKSEDLDKAIVKLNKSKKYHSSSDSDHYQEDRTECIYISDDSDVEKVKKEKKQRHYTSEESDEKSVKKKKKKSKKHKKKKTHSKQQSYTKKHKDIPGLFESKLIFAEDIADIAPEFPFKLDRTPDENSWTYGSLYNGHIAHYKSVCNQCVGTDEKTAVFMKDASKKKTDSHSGDRYYSKENRKRIRATVDEVVAVDCDNTERWADYIHVTETSEDFNTDRNIDIRDKVIDPATALFVVGKGKPEQDVDLEEPQYDPVRHKIGLFNKKLRETPNDVDLWLKFIQFQDRLGDSVETSSIEKNTSSGLYVKKISILGKALEHNPGNMELLLAKIKLSSEISDSAKVNKEIEDLLFLHPANAKLWKFYLMFNQSRLSTLSVTKMKEIYHKCFTTLFGILDGKVHVARKSNNLENEIIDIFLQYCYFLKQAGLKEHTIAIFQAMLEYNFFMPEYVKKSDKKVKMAAFAEFWDSNCARVGSSEALGWSKWCERGKPENPASSNNDPLEEIEESTIEEKLPKHITWLKLELLRDGKHWLPWQPGEGQTINDCEEEDLERLVLFDDISPVLFELSEKNHVHFVLSYLQFLGFKSATDSTSSEKQGSFFCEHLNDIVFEPDKGSLVGNAITAQDLELPRQIAINTVNLLLPCFTGTEKSQMTLTLIEIHLSKYSSVNPSKQDKKDMRKVFKNILKEECNRNDLYLWCSYVKLEKSIGKGSEAKSIVETALTMHSGETIDSHNVKSNGIITLFVQYCEILLNIDSSMPCRMLPKIPLVTVETKTKVLYILRLLADGKKYNSSDSEVFFSDTAVLRVVSKFANLCSDAREAVVSYSSTGSKSPNVLIERLTKLTWCYGLCLFCKGDMNASLENYSTTLKQITTLKGDNSANIQLVLGLTLDKLRLILYYLSTSAISLHVLRDNLDTALKMFPDHPILLSLFLNVERMSRISGRLNKYFDKCCRTTDSAVPVVYAVMNHLTVQEQTEASGSNGLIHRCRTWLEHSLSRNELQQCVLLWRIYLQLEKVAGDTKRLKGLFYRALQHCPWAKILYIDGIQLFGEDQLEEIVDLMTEKDLHVQLPVEELDVLMSS